eukprot:TRINITY_DN33617_c0_g2_i1.p1 TRINITY_DN33617_c0_g2~~TRINITY_DN33617_c0_g2_i1.p1  ORF type:complete len:862 (-),score=139.65 TRINITY_DN33617_c0_g2_i1:294-2843(-)
MDEVDDALAKFDRVSNMLEELGDHFSLPEKLGSFMINAVKKCFRKFEISVSFVVTMSFPIPKPWMGLKVGNLTLCLDPYFMPILHEPVCLSLRGEAGASLDALSFELEVFEPKVMPVFNPLLSPVAMISHPSMPVRVGMEVMSSAPWIQRVYFRAVFTLTDQWQVWSNNYDHLGLCQIDAMMENFHQSVDEFRSTRRLVNPNEPQYTEDLDAAARRLIDAVRNVQLSQGDIPIDSIKFPRGEANSSTHSWQGADDTKKTRFLRTQASNQSDGDQHRYLAEVPFPVPKYGPVGKLTMCKRLIVDVDLQFPVSALEAPRSYVMMRLEDRVKFSDLLAATLNSRIKIPSALKGFLDYIFPQIGPVLLYFEYEGDGYNTNVKVKLLASAGQAGMEFMLRYEYKVALTEFRVEADIVAQQACLGLPMGDGCTGIRITRSNLVGASDIAFRAYDEITSEMKKEFPGWTPEFQRNSVGPTLQLLVGIRMLPRPKFDARLAGQVRAVSEVCGKSLSFLGEVQVAFEITESKLHFNAAFRVAFFSGEVEFGVSIPPNGWWARVGLKLSADFGSIIPLGGIVKEVFGWKGFSFSASASFVFDSDEGLELSASILGFRVSLSFGGRRLANVEEEFKMQLQSEFNSSDVGEIISKSEQDSSPDALTRLQSIVSAYAEEVRVGAEAMADANYTWQAQPGQKCGASWEDDWAARTTQSTVEDCKQQCLNATTCNGITYSAADGLLGEVSQCVLCKGPLPLETHEDEHWTTYQQVAEYPFKIKFSETGKKEARRLLTPRRLGLCSGEIDMLNDLMENPGKLGKRIGSKLKDIFCDIDGIKQICKAFKVMQEIKKALKKLKKVFR